LIVLDENVLEGQRLLLADFYLPVLRHRGYFSAFCATPIWIRKPREWAKWSGYRTPG
jgi:hypothetical protein